MGGRIQNSPFGCPFFSVLVAHKRFKTPYRAIPYRVFRAIALRFPCIAPGSPIVLYPPKKALSHPYALYQGGHRESSRPQQGIPLYRCIAALVTPTVL